MRYLLSLIVTLSLCLFVADLAHAQSVSLTLSPPVTEILLAPGKSVSQTFTLKTTGEVGRITPEIHLVKAKDDQGHVEIDPNPINEDSTPLLITTHSPSSGLYTLTFQAANTDLVEDIYLALVLKADSPAIELNGDNLQSTPAISALIFITLNPAGLIPIDLEIQNFDSPYFHDSSRTLTLTPKLMNNTPIMIRPEGKFEVTSPTDKSKLDIPLYPNLILGKSSRSILAENATPLTYSPPWYAIGPHRLRLTIISAGGTKLTDIEKIVWLFPLRLILTIFSLILLLTLILKHVKFKRV